MIYLSCAQCSWMSCNMHLASRTSKFPLICPSIITVILSILRILVSLFLDLYLSTFERTSSPIFSIYFYIQMFQTIFCLLWVRLVEDVRYPLFLLISILWLFLATCRIYHHVLPNGILALPVEDHWYLWLSYRIPTIFKDLHEPK